MILHMATLFLLTKLVIRQKKTRLLHRRTLSLFRVFINERTKSRNKHIKKLSSPAPCVFPSSQTTMSSIKGTVDLADGIQTLLRSRFYDVLVLVLAILTDTINSSIP